MKKKMVKLYKKVRHNTRLFLESIDFLTNTYLNRMEKKFNEKYGELPINNKKIVFTNYMGRGYGCNCKYVVEEILKQNMDYDMVWLINENEDKTIFPDRVRLIDYKSEEALYEYATSKYWISNYHLAYFIKKGLRKKDGQVYIQMWHGSFGIKKIEKHVPGLTESKMWLKVAKMNSEMTDYWISHSEFESNVYKTAFWDVKNIVSIGHPRNDLFFKDNSNIKNNIHDNYNISREKKILLYMPTFREDYRLDCYQIDAERIVKALSKKFGGEWVILLRLHPRIASLHEKLFGRLNSKLLIDVTQYNDVQELLASADAMISDYSSCIFDYLLSRRPAFIFATDLDEYINERGFYYSIEETPFDIARNNDELEFVIANYNESLYKERVDEFLLEKGSVEEGDAATKLLDLMGKV